MGGIDARALHAVDRLTFGASTSLLADVEAMGVEAWIEQQLVPASIGDGALETTLLTFVSLHAGNVGRLGYAFTPDQAALDVQLATFVRAVSSKRQLQEVVMALWSDHLNTSLTKEQLILFKASEDAQLRSSALGRYADLLRLSAKSPAMLTYLDNATSRWPTPNENYGRELLELHTVGVEGGYDEDDIRQCAHAFTGWGINGLTREFEFSAQGHYNGELRVLGWSHPGGSGAGAVERGEQLLDYLAHHPATARRIAAKLCQRFVADQPSAALLRSTAAAYLAADTNIADTLRHIFASEEFWASAGGKLRRPFEMLVAAVRGMDATVRAQGGGLNGTLGGIREHLRRAGQAPFEWGPPDGYPDTAGHWSGTGSVLARWNMVLGLARGLIGGIEVDPVSFFPVGSTVGDAVAGLGPRMLGRPLPIREHKALLTFAAVSSDADVAELSDVKRRHLLALVMASRTAQVR